MLTTIGRIASAGLLILSLALMGCAGMPADQTETTRQTRSTEDLLSAAGFKQIYPATPQQKAHLSSMPQKQLFMVDRKGKLFYVYADAQGCGCLYAGNQQKYQAFQNLAAQYRMAAMQYQAAQMNMESSFEWNYWPDWGETGTFN